MFCILYPKICQLNKFSPDLGDSQKKKKKKYFIPAYVRYTFGYAVSTKHLAFYSMTSPPHKAFTVVKLKI